MALSPKRARFVEEYLKDLNATQAAIRAGYAPKPAKVTASKLLSDPEVAKAVADLKAARSERTQIDSDWVLTRLAQEVEADLADIYDDEGALLPIKEWPEIWRKGLVQGIDVEEITVEGQSVGQVRKIRISDRIKRIELIGKHVEVQAFRDQVGIGGPNGGPVETITRQMTPQEAAEAYAATLDSDEG